MLAGWMLVIVFKPRFFPHTHTHAHSSSFLMYFHILKIKFSFLCSCVIYLNSQIYSFIYISLLLSSSSRSLSSSYVRGFIDFSIHFVVIVITFKMKAARRKKKTKQKDKKRHLVRQNIWWQWCWYVIFVVDDGCYAISYSTKPFNLVSVLLCFILFSQWKLVFGVFDRQCWR